MKASSYLSMKIGLLKLPWIKKLILIKTAQIRSLLSKLLRQLLNNHLLKMKYWLNKSKLLRVILQKILLSLRNQYSSRSLDLRLSYPKIWERIRVVEISKWQNKKTCLHIRLLITRDRLKAIPICKIRSKISRHLHLKSRNKESLSLNPERMPLIHRHLLIKWHLMAKPIDPQWRKTVMIWFQF